MKYLLHTTALADYLSGQPHVLARLKSTAPIDIAVASPTIAEIRYAFIRRPDMSVKAETMFNTVIGTVTVLPFDRSDADEAARILAETNAAAAQIDALTAQVCAMARRRDLTLIVTNRTSDLRPIDRIHGLRIIDWGLPVI